MKKALNKPNSRLLKKTKQGNWRIKEYKTIAKKHNDS